jgi:ubiquinone/menaquinone biosynthesis C-methylase UbiE
MAEVLRARIYGATEHPYEIFEKEVVGRVRPSSVLLDVGCGRSAPVLRKFQGVAGRLVGIDVVPFTESIPGIELLQGDLCQTGLPDCSVDVAMARSVMEHVVSPDAAYREMARVLKPGGSFTFLTANLWDYASLIALSVPNQLHPWIVKRTEGRDEADVFPTAYKNNTRAQIYRSAGRAGLVVDRFQYLTQYPNYFMFNGFLFLIAAAYERVISLVPGLQFLQGWILATIRKPGPSE